MTGMGRRIKEWESEGGMKFLKKIGIRHGQVVLDFGCNRGNYAIPAAKIVGETGKVYALDKDSEALGGLMRKAKSWGLTNIIRVDTSGKLNVAIEDESIDTILIFDVIHLIGWRGNKKRSLRGDRKILYEEIWRIAKPNAIISVYPNHLETHTDISSSEDVRKEIEDSGFVFQEEISEKLLHDNKPVHGRIIIFRKPENNDPYDGMKSGKR